MVAAHEITVELDTNLKTLSELLQNQWFNIIEEFDLNDIYMIKKDFKESDSYLKKLSNCVIIRNWVYHNRHSEEILYKHKEYDENENITNQFDVKCKIESIPEAKSLLEAIWYEECIKIFDHIFVYSNWEDEFVVQHVNNKHIYIELEDHCSRTNKEYQSVEEMKTFIRWLNIPLKWENFFVKKAEIEMSEKYPNL